MRLFAAVLAVLLAVPAHAIRVERVSGVRSTGIGGGAVELEAVAGQALVRFDSGLTAAERASALYRIGSSIVQEIGATGWYQVLLPSGMSVQGALVQLRAISGVLEAVPNRVYRPLRTPNDLNFASQYHLGKINAPAAWEYGVGDANRVTIGVIDAGVEGTHPDLQAKFANTTSWFCNPGACKVSKASPAFSYECVNASGDDIACVAETAVKACNHGTRVAGLAAAVSNNGTGVAGVSWGAQLMSLRVFRTADCSDACGDAGGNICATDDAAIANAISTATLLNNQAAYGRIVLNISLGSAGIDSNGNDVPCSSVLQGVINAAVATSTGLVIMAATGNESTAVSSPAKCAGVIPVGATDQNDNIASFSNRGTELASNGLVAPGVSLTTTDLYGGVTSNATGTSFSAPLAAGVAALMLSVKPALSPTEVKAALRGGAVGIGVSSVAEARPNGNSSGSGQLNAFRAVKFAVDGSLAGFAGDRKVIAFPNPFRTSETGSVTITIPTGLQSRGTSIRIYTIDGQLVRDLKTQTTWDGKNDGGNQVASGTYLVLVKTDAGTQTGKLAVIR